MGKPGRKKSDRDRSSSQDKRGSVTKIMLNNGGDTVKFTDLSGPRTNRDSSSVSNASNASTSKASTSKASTSKASKRPADRSGTEDSDNRPLNGSRAPAAREDDDYVPPAKLSKPKEAVKPPSKESSAKKEKPAEKVKLKMEKEKENENEKTKDKIKEKEKEKTAEKAKAPTPAKKAGISEPIDVDALDDPDEYEVEAIIGKTVTNGVTKFLVRWKGYDSSSDTWEAERDLNCDELIQQFLAKESAKSKSPPKQSAKKSPAAGRGNKKDAAGTSSDAEKEWLVERIIDFVEDPDTGGLYRIRWKGFGPKDDTWEPESNLSCDALIEKFRRERSTDERVDAKELRESPKKTKRLVNECYPRTDMSNRIGRSSKRAAAKSRVFYGED
ncbi:hypothetical protein KR018_001281 [Drosophila ironensis]|nr:hypothetical protein KR018_001281 [Drosophila ironensis]